MAHQPNSQPAAYSPLPTALILIGGTLGVLLSAALLPAWLPGLVESLRGPEPKAPWYLARVAGLLAYLLLSLSIVLGLLTSSRLARRWPGAPAAIDLHQFTSLLVIGLSAFHALVLLGDRYTGFSLGQLLLPFAARAYQPFWVGLGQTGFYLAALVAGSYYWRQRIGPRVWRRLHYASFAVYVLVTAHGLGAGTDASAPPVRLLYATSALAILGLTAIRVLARPKARPGPCRPGPGGRVNRNVANASPVPHVAAVE